jgi:hypothetical protein
VSEDSEGRSEGVGDVEMRRRKEQKMKRRKEQKGKRTTGQKTKVRR